MLRDALVSLSLANLSFWYSWVLLLYADASQYYYLEFPPDATYALMVIVEVLLFATGFWVVVTIVRRSDNPWLVRMAKLTFILVLAAIVFSTRGVAKVTPLLWIYALCNQIGGVALTVVAMAGCLVCAFFVVRYFNSVVRALATLVLILSPFVAVTFIQAGMVIARDLVRNGTGDLSVATQRKITVPSQSNRRVVWIIFDEMDQRLSFSERPDFLHLPEFDRLRQESLFAANAYPPHKSTMESLPALLTGRLVSRGVPVGPDDIEITYLDSEDSVSWKEQPNVFSMANERSLNVAGGGYGHSYCRLFGDILTSCFSHSRPYYDWKGRNWPSSLLDAVHNQISPLLPFGERYTAIREYRSMLNYAKEVAVDNRLNLVFLHFRVPHRPCIYNMEKQRLSVFYDYVSYYSGKGYFSSLALADRTLGEIRRVLASAGLWKRTTLIVSADHSLRRKQNRYDRKFDRRVPFLLNLADEKDAITYEAEFNTVLTCDLVLAILGGQLSDINDVVSWLDEHRDRQPIMGAITEG